MTRRETQPLSSAGLFAGIGGIESGFERAAMQTVLLVENDAAAAHVLKTRFPDADVVSDVRDLYDLPRGLDVLAAGFPCQDLSSVGLKQGIDGVKSSLIGEVFRLIERTEVPWLVLENVPFLLHLGGGEALALITKRLQELEYRWAYRVVDAAAFGLPQRRRRWILAASRVHDPRNVLLTDEATDAHAEPSSAASYGFYWTEGTRALGWAPNAVPPLKCGSTIGVPSPPAIVLPSKAIVVPDIRDAERLQGFPADWTQPAEEVARPSQRWRLVGNAVSVMVSEWVASRIVTPGERDHESDPPLDTARRWPDSAWWDGARSARAQVSDHPVSVKSVPIHDFLGFPTKPLSLRATAGFLKRAEKGSLRFQPWFLDTVREHAERMQSIAQADGNAA